MSKEENLFKHHTIVPNGYDVGRDLLVESATRGSRFGKRAWTANVSYVDHLLRQGSRGVNHNISIDGRVAVLTVTRMQHH